MRYLATLILLLWATVAQAGDFLTDHAGMWEGQGTTSDGIKWTFYARIDQNGAKWNSIDDGCEGTWDFQQVHANQADGWEDVLVGRDRCYLGLRIVLTTYDASRIKAEWYLQNGMFVAEAMLWPVQ
jgi:hypothetical protein